MRVDLTKLWFDEGDERGELRMCDGHGIQVREEESVAEGEETWLVVVVGKGWRHRWVRGL